MQDTNFKDKLKKGLLEYCVLLCFKNKPMYSSELIEMLVNHDLITTEGTIYPLLSRLKRNEYLEYEWEESPSGPPRKYYKLTKAGESALNEYSNSYKELTKSLKLLMKGTDEKDRTSKSK